MDVSREADEHTLATWLKMWYELYAKPNIRLNHFYPFGVWVKMWGKHLTHTKNQNLQQKILKNRSFRGFLELLGGFEPPTSSLPRRLRNFFLTIFNVLWPYPLHSVYFLSLSKIKVSAHSAALCGNLCGQTVGGVDFRDLTICTNVVRTRFSVCPTFLQSTAKHFAMVLTMMRDVKGISILSH